MRWKIFKSDKSACDFMTITRDFMTRYMRPPGQDREMEDFPIQELSQDPRRFMTRSLRPPGQDREMEDFPIQELSQDPRLTGYCQESARTRP